MSLQDSLDSQETLEEVRQSAGTHFAPELVEVFEQSMEAILAIRESYKD